MFVTFPRWIDLRPSQPANVNQTAYLRLNYAAVNSFFTLTRSAAALLYEIDFAWKKGEHPKQGKFSPDFFIKAGDLIVVVEIKGDEELREPSEENRKKNEYTIADFYRKINAR